MKPLTRRDLDETTCAVPGCDHTHHDEGLYLSGVCHPKAPVRALYHDGVLVFTCAVCEEFITRVAVAAGWH